MWKIFHGSISQLPYTFRIFLLQLFPSYGTNTMPGHIEYFNAYNTAGAESSHKQSTRRRISQQFSLNVTKERILLQASDRSVWVARQY